MIICSSSLLKPSYPENIKLESFFIQTVFSRIGVLSNFAKKGVIPDMVSIVKLF